VLLVYYFIKETAELFRTKICNSKMVTINARAWWSAT